MGGVSTIFLGFGSQIVTTNFVSGIDLVSGQPGRAQKLDCRER